MHALDAFAATVRVVDPPLDRATALIAAVGRPEVDADTLVAALDRLAQDCRSTDAAGLCAELFGPGAFRGDSTDYYDPRNSLLDQVLDRRIGIPITLSVVAIEVARRRDIALCGVGMPGHFLVASPPDVDRSVTGPAPRDRVPFAFFDPFDGGRPLDRSGCERLFRRLHDGALVFDLAHLAPTPDAWIVRRILNNLRGAHARRGDRNGLARAALLQSVLPGTSVAERTEIAEVVASAGRFDEAASLLDALVTADPANAESHAVAAQRLRARSN